MSEHLRWFQAMRDPYLRRHCFCDSLLVLYFWFGLLVLTAVGNVNVFPSESLGRFVVLGTTTILLSAIVLWASWSRINSSIWVIFSSVILAVLPVITISPQNSQRVLLLDLYYVLLITAPVFFSLWTWQIQVVISLLGLSAVGIMWLPEGTWIGAHSITLVLAAAILSVLVARLRAKEHGNDSVRLEQQGLELFAENSQQRSIQATWNILLLQAGLLLVMVFFDVAITGGQTLQPIVIKVYGLILLVLGGLMVKAISGVHATRILVSITMMVGLILSMSRTGYGAFQSASFSIPIIFLAFVLLAAPWRLELQIVVIWGLVLADLIAKYLSGTGVWGVGLRGVGYMLEYYRGELLVITVGCLSAIAASRALQRSRAGSIAESVVLSPGGAAYLETESETQGDELSAHLLPFSAQVSMGIVRRQLLISGILAPGIVSAIVASQLLAKWGDDYYHYGMVYWLGFLFLFILLVRAERRPHNESHFWIVASFANLLLFMVPCILLLATQDPGFLWIYWPVGLVLAIGSIPWLLREIVPLLLAAAITGVELVYELNLNFVSIGFFVAALLYAVLSWIKSNRQLKEKNLLHGFQTRLSASRNIDEVLETLADYITYLFESPWAVISKADNHLEIVRAGKRYPLAADTWPIRQVWQQFRDLGFSSSSRAIRAANWLTPPIGFLDQRFGIFTANHGLAVQLRMVEDENSKQENPVEFSYIFVKLRIPFFAALLEKELRIAATMVDFSRIKLDGCRALQGASRLAEDADNRIQDREHELSSLVHDINNTVQDLTLLCDSILDDLERSDSGVTEKSFFKPISLTEDIKRIATVARSVATVVSDAKRRRELERMVDLKPRELVEVQKVIKEIGLFAKIRAERKRISVKVPEPTNELIWVRVSVREHLETILRNLLNNAVTYSSPGSAVEICLRTDETDVQIEIVDNGPGLSLDDQREIFVKGYRGKTATGIPGGLGLGLAESRRVAETAGGSLTVHSAGEGKGSTFTVSLPRHHGPATENSTDRSWVLIVEDQPALSEFYGRLGNALGYSPGIAGSVPEALAIVGSRGRPSFVITDIHLGATSGLDLVRNLREEFGQSLPILVVSGLAEESVAEQARLAGATDFVAKPIGRQALFARIQSLLSQVEV